MHFKDLCYLPLLAAALAAALTLSACSSSEDYINPTHGAKAEDGATYGSGPDNTKPYPQIDPVNLNGVGGASVAYEPLSRGGNKNYSVLGKDYQVWRDCRSYLEIGMASWYGPGFHGNKTSNGEVYNQKGFTAAHKNLPLPSYLKVTNLENGRAVVVRVNDRGPFHGQRIIDLSEGAARAIGMTGKGTALVKLEYLDVRQGGLIANIAHTVESGQGLEAAAATSASGTNNDAIGDFIKDLQETKGTQGASAGTYTYAYTAPKPEQQPALEESAGTAQNFQISYAAAPLPANTPAYAGASAFVQIFTTSDQKRAARVQRDYRSNTSYPIVIAAEEGLYRVRIGPVPENDLQRVLLDMKNQGFKDAFIKR